MGKVGVIDLGSGYIKVVIADDEGNIVGNFDIRSKGLDRGTIVKNRLLLNSLKNALKGAKDAAGEEPEGYHVLLSHPGIKSENVKVDLNLSEGFIEVSREDIERLYEKAKAEAEEEGYKIIHVIPRFFLIDGEKYLEPEGLTASRIEAEFHVVKIPLPVYRNVERLLKLLGRKFYGLMFPSLVAGESVLQEEDEEEEFEINTLLLDLGHTTVGFLYLEGGVPKVSGVLPFGAKSIISAVSKIYRISSKEVEKILKEHGTVIPSEVDDVEEILLRTRDGKEISVRLKELSHVFNQEFLGIIEKVVENLYKKGINIDRAIDRIVLVGGLAQLRGVKELLEEIFEREVIVGIPSAVGMLNDRTSSTIYAPAVGGILYLFKSEWKPSEGFLDNFGPFGGEEPEPPVETLPPSIEGGRSSEKRGFFGKIIGFFKGIFSED